MRLPVTPAIAVVPLAAAIAACTAGAPGTSSPAASGQPPLPVATPVVTPVAPTAMPAGTFAPVATAAPDEGNVDGPVAPELSIEPVGAQIIRVTVADPAAKAWRVTVLGTGEHAGDRWVLEVATGDVAPDITTVDASNGVAPDPQEQNGLGTGSTTGRICSTVVPVCTAARSVRLPENGNGTLVLELTRTDAAQALGVSAATAGWPSEPFALGPWTTTEAFAWEP